MRVNLDPVGHFDVDRFGSASANLAHVPEQGITRLVEAADCMTVERAKRAGLVNSAEKNIDAKAAALAAAPARISITDLENLLR